MGAQFNQNTADRINQRAAAKAKSTQALAA
jgi:hypothetical protein